MPSPWRHAQFVHSVAAFFLQAAKQRIVCFLVLMNSLQNSMVGGTENTKIERMINIRTSRTAFQNVSHFYPGNLKVSYSIELCSLLPNGRYWLYTDEQNKFTNLINSSLWQICLQVLIPSFKNTRPASLCEEIIGNRLKVFTMVLLSQDVEVFGLQNNLQFYKVLNYKNL